MFGPPKFMLGLCLEKVQEANDMLRRGQKEHSRQSGTNKFKFIFQQYMQLSILKR